MEFDSTKHKIQKSFELEDQNAQDIKTLKRIDIFGRPENTKKRIVVLPLISTYDFQNGLGGTFSEYIKIIQTGAPFGPFNIWLPRTLIFTISLTNFSEWAIPMTKIVPIFSVDDAWDKTKITFTNQFRYWWKKIDDLNWDVYIELIGTATIAGHTSLGTLIPLYLDLDMVIVNEHIWQEVDTSKS